MKKLITVIICALVLAGCGAEIENADIAGDWENENAQIHFNEDGAYEIRYLSAEVGEKTAENGKYEIDGGKIEFKVRDKYTLEETGDTKFERLVHTEDRKEKISLESDEQLELNKTVYNRRETN